MKGYETLIYQAELSWYKGENEQAVEFYKAALKERQAGRISKKSIRENIKELQEC